LVKLFDDRARKSKVNLQRSAHIGALTDSSYVQLVGKGVASIDVGFPCRYTHSSLELCDVGDLEGLAKLLIAALPAIGPTFSLRREDYPQ
jgi:putative aminopeptidase FrvX